MTPPRSKPQIAIVWSGADELRPSLRELASLVENVDNVRVHGERSVAAIAESLRTYGQQKPIVVIPSGTVLAGNGTLRAAKLLGWSHLAVVAFSGSPEEAVQFALADNRTAELSAWDDGALSAMIEGLGDLPDIYWTDEELEALLSGDGDSEPDRLPPDFRKKDGQQPAPDESDRLTPKFCVLIECADEADQLTVLERLLAEGLQCRALTS